ncbi:hypothetical protein DV736_g1758, partial [Chaetothyriales sp. CBS 134916]
MEPVALVVSLRARIRLETEMAVSETMEAMRRATTMTGNKPGTLENPLSAEEVSLSPNYRKAAEVHRQARLWAQESIKPGHTLLDIAQGIEDSVRPLLGHSGLEPGDSLKAGMDFPTGLCLNHQVAHYTPNPGQKDVVLQQQDVMKVDFGVHINGWIIDSAFTIAFDHTYDSLLDATAGIDVRVSDISAAIQEAMESYEVEIGGKPFPVKPVRSLKLDQTKMEEGEVFAIETFGTTGRGYLRDDIKSLVSNAIMETYQTLMDIPGSYSAQFEHADAVKTVLREKFDKLTPEDFASVAGNRPGLIAKVAEKHGLSSEEAEKQVTEAFASAAAK